MEDGDGPQIDAPFIDEEIDWHTSSLGIFILLCCEVLILNPRAFANRFEKCLHDMDSTWIRQLSSMLYGKDLLLQSSIRPSDFSL